MKLLNRIGLLAQTAPLLSALVLSSLAFSQSTPAPATEKYPEFPSERPTKFEPVTSNLDYVRRDVMIPMRDGVKLHTVILVPKGAKNRADPADAHAVRRERADHAIRKARTSARFCKATTMRPT